MKKKWSDLNEKFRNRKKEKKNNKTLKKMYNLLYAMEMYW